MDVPTALQIAVTILGKMRGLLKPKKRKDAKALADSSVKQTSVFGKNVVIQVFPGGQKTPYLGLIDDIPDDLIKKVVEQIQRNDLDPEKEGIRLISNNEFRKEMDEYSKDFRKPSKLDDILPFLKEEYKSVLKLALRIEKLLKEDRHDEVSKVKVGISKQYKKDGTTLCRLYLTGYMEKFIAHFSEDVMKKGIDRNTLSKLINERLHQFINDSDSLFFIQETDNMVHVIHRIIERMEEGTPFIGIHASGYWNIQKAKKILIIIKDDIKHYGYFKREIKIPIKSMESPIYYVGLINRDYFPIQKSS